MKLSNTRMIPLSLCVWLASLIGVFGWAIPQVQAQNNDQGYLAPCDGQQNRCTGGLICVSGICVHVCDAVQKLCPHKEPCQIQANGQGGCYCKSHGDCPAGTVCNGGQCSGTGRKGDLCDDTSPCARDLYCARPVDTKENRCYPICVGVVCNDALGNQSPCVSISGTPFGVCFCNDNAQCAVGVCFNGSCKLKSDRGEACTRQIGCSVGLSCVFETTNSTTGRCHPTCVKNTDCVNGELCVVKGGQRVCLCDFIYPCTSGAECSQGLCNTYPRCDKLNPCAADTICYFPIPGRDEGVCIKTCTNNNECANSTACLSLPTGVGKGCYCRSDNDCPTKGNECRNHQCQTPCFQTAQCPFDKICKDSYCVSPGAEDPLPERDPPAEPTKDAGIVTPPRDTRPACDPPCDLPLTCNVTTGTCQKLAIGVLCDKDDNCESGLCFGPAFPKPKICSVTDCSKCAGFALECQTHGGKEACYRREVVSPPPPPPPSTCGCTSADGAPSWTWCLLLALCVFVATRRHA